MGLPQVFVNPLTCLGERDWHLQQTGAYGPVDAGRTRVQKAMHAHVPLSLGLLLRRHRFRVERMRREQTLRIYRNLDVQASV